ncbi:hypothetical protein ACSI5N_07215 [Raoultella ornithinolytica]|uniref:hypothetical protein n=1 Tax=Raoultella ornithinolytica TaxID=54291 RepID=UPI0002CD0D18|nr:hypothetical protein [Raoultella ornithinolytica]AGJ85113.1 hypothetical protein RORB6_02075 [Raoultella ornithinolytica B6]
MKRILFITHNNEDESDGIWKKITFQVKAFRELGYSVDFFFARIGCIVCDDGVNKSSYPLEMGNKYSFYKIVNKIIKSGERRYDFCYVRKPHGGLFCLYLSPLLSYIKKKGGKVILEIPTYPYKSELKTFKEKTLNYVFNFSRFFFIKYIDIICYFGTPVSNIWGVKCVRISNGIDIDTVTLIPEKKVGDVFTIVGVANLSFWHGYDRVLYGLSNYKGSSNVIFKIIGDTEPEFSRLRKIVISLGIEDRVKFCGRLSGKNLENEYYQADLCIDAVGRHRSGNDYNSSIKSKEYTARGLPFVKSHVDDAFSGNEFILDIEPTDNEISIEEIISWRKNLSDGFSKRERLYAIENLTWANQLQKVISEFN